MPKINCLPDQVYIDVNSSQTILQALLDNDIAHTHICGGNANCSTCRIMILDGIDNCSEQTVAEKVLARRLEFPFHVRLACQTKVFGNVSIRRLILDQEDIDLVEGQLSLETLGVRKSIAILLATVRGASNFDEVNFHYDLIYTMSRYFQSMNKIINRYGGFINNYMNYSLIGVFGLNEPKDASERAVWAGLEMLIALKDLNLYLERLSYPPLSLSIGIHYGSVVLVPVDTYKRVGKYNLIGDTVNIVNRIEAANREVGSELLVSSEIYNHIQRPIIINRTYTLRSANKNKDYSVLEIIGINGKPPVITEKVEVVQPKMSLKNRVKSFLQKFSSSWDNSG